MPRPPLDLSVIVTTPEGNTYRWAGDASAPANVPTDLSFRTKRGDGFADANITLSRLTDRDYVDVSLLNDIKIIGAGGDVAYEGRISGAPRSSGDGGKINVQAAGWMAHAKDYKFSEIYIDRDLTHWTAGTPARRLTISARPTVTGPEVKQDTSTGTPMLHLAFTGAWAGATAPACEAWYDGRGIPLGGCYSNWRIDSPTHCNTTAGDANWLWQHSYATQSDGGGASGSGDLQTASTTGSFTRSAPTTTSTFMWLEFLYTAGPGGTAGVEWYVDFYNLAVYGSHGLTIRGTSPGGVYASDVIKNIVGRFCPKLNTAGVVDTTFPIQHLVFIDRTYPFDAFAEVNRYHQWSLSVWENRTLTFAPVDLTNYDWQVRSDDPGVEIELQGDSSEVVYNGIAVTFTDAATGRVSTVTPSNDSSLTTTDPNNPANRQGINRWAEISLSTPVTYDMAVQFGRAQLADLLTPKAPGTIRVKGHIRDRSGNWQPVWKVRADQRIAIVDHPNSSPRLIVETDYQHDGSSVSIAVDAPFQRMDAVFDRIQTALQAANLS